MKKSNIKLQFSVKKKEELDGLSYEELLKYVKELTDNIVQEKPKKGSDNSSIPPSVDIAKKKRKNQSLRAKSDKKAGGQKGRAGITLRQVDKPDITIGVGYGIDRCRECGTSLEETIQTLKERRQVLDIDLRRTQTQIAEYQSFSKTCPACGYENHDDSFPTTVTPNISYGVGTQAVVAYLSTSHYIPYDRITQTLSDLFGITLSEGTVDNMIKRTSLASQEELTKIVDNIKRSKIIGIDETGCKVDGEGHWHWAFQDSKNTFIVADKSRAAKVIDEHFEEGFPDACAVHDNYSSYNGLTAKSEQLCLAHKLRDLNYAIACDDTRLMKDMKTLLKEAIRDHKKDLTPQQRVILKAKYEESFAYLLERPTIEKSETAKQISSFTKARDKIFTFLLHPDIPPDNNGSERAIRNVKVKLKVSGQFKTLEGAKDYATLRSIIDTSRKRGLNEFESLSAIIRGESVF